MPFFTEAVRHPAVAEHGSRVLTTKGLRNIQLQIISIAMKLDILLSNRPLNQQCSGDSNRDTEGFQQHRNSNNSFSQLRPFRTENHSGVVAPYFWDFLS